MSDLQHMLTFLGQLQANNHKAWMDANKADCQQARSTLLDVAEHLIKHMGSLDPDVASLTPQSCIFRINRDIRFSKHKAPYKSNMGIYLAKGGRHSGYAGYYLHLEPDNRSFIGGGLYQPEPAALKRIRQEIDYQAADLNQILAEPRFKALFGPLQGEKLQRPPQGYSEDHPQIALLKLKSFTAVHPITDQAVTQDDFLPYTLEAFRVMMPLVRFLNTALED